MCQRTCPNCKSTAHIEGFGIEGLYIVCEGCGSMLAHRFDEQAAPTDCKDIDAYTAERTWVLPGAEAVDPADDEIYTPRLTP